MPGRYLVMPKSLRLMVVLMSAPHISFLFIGLGPHLKLLTASLTGLVTPSRVKSPSAATTLSPSKTSLLDLKVMVGYLAVLKKPSTAMCSFQSGKPMFSEATSMVRSTEPVVAARAGVMVPAVLSRRPRWVEKARWLISKVGKVWKEWIL